MDIDLSVGAKRDDHIPMKIDPDAADWKGLPVDNSDSKLIKTEPQDTIIIIDDHDITSLRPQKRQRFKMEVVLPSLDQVKRERLIKKEEDSKTFESFRNVSLLIRIHFESLIHLNYIA
jgi:hypothetical protein